MTWNIKVSKNAMICEKNLGFLKNTYNLGKYTSIINITIKIFSLPLGNGCMIEFLKGYISEKYKIKYIRND